jgi:hypothetical protein
MTSDALDLDCQCDGCGAFFGPDQLDVGHVVVVLVRGANEYRCPTCATAAGAGSTGEDVPGHATEPA